MSLMEMLGKLKIPVSALSDTLKEVEKVFHFTIVLKDSERNVSPRDTIPVEFDYEFIMATGEEDTAFINLHAK